VQQKGVGDAGVASATPSYRRQGRGGCRSAITTAPHRNHYHQDAITATGNRGRRGCRPGLPSYRHRPGKGGGVAVGVVEDDQELDEKVGIGWWTPALAGAESTVGEGACLVAAVTARRHHSTTRTSTDDESIGVGRQRDELRRARVPEVGDKRGKPSKSAWSGPLATDGGQQRERRRGRAEGLEGVRGWGEGARGAVLGSGQGFDPSQAKPTWSVGPGPTGPVGFGPTNPIGLVFI
jgi:hypothetical protein